MSVVEIRHDGATTIFTLNRPEARNAINVEMAEVLHFGFAEFDASSQKVAIITAAGDDFAQGADLGDTPTVWKVYPTLGLKTDKPVICAVNGLALGAGFIMALMSDLCVASERAVFHYSEAQIGVSIGGIVTLAARIPHKLAMEVMLLGRPVHAQRAQEMGFVNQVVPHGQQLEAALVRARELETMAPLVLKMLKRFVTEHTLNQSPYEKMARIQSDIEIVSSSDDWAVGMAAYLDNRSVSFRWM
ncbi:enoyl-CoA hydratase-related protein [Sphingobium sp. H39-3-25]|uniref:enoyl-CoA hydratase/isomerase family protein n=1 Tax=Sphingobium arseniciresistens TaxID=3030834 RepID=UPI0023B94B1D|nr:enoyl-CoA hydratase-related protein [Sphingobium arseniciresistens]